MPVPHSTSSLWLSSHFVSLSSSHSPKASHCASLPGACTSSILVVVSSVWCSWVTSCGCWFAVRSILLLQSPSVLTSSDGAFRSLLPWLLGSHCSLAATKDTRVVFRDLWTAAPLDSSASAMFIPLSTGGFSIVPPIRLLPSWVAIVAGWPDVASLWCVARVCPSSVAQGGWMWQSRVSSMLDIECCCPYDALCRSCWVISMPLFLIFAKTFRNSTQLRGFLCAFFFTDVPTLLRR